MKKKNLLNLSYDELLKEIISIKEPEYRAGQIFISLHKKNINSIKDISDIPLQLREKLAESYFIPLLKNIKITDSEQTVTKKFLFEINNSKDNMKINSSVGDGATPTEAVDDGKENYFIETVLISENDRETICISTQVGCNVGCEFCATGKMGFRKNLDVGEIIAQVYEVKRLTGIEPTNIVYMGMGEPFLNYDNMLKSLKILTHAKGMGLSSKRITVSTVGFVGKIRKFADDIMLEENKSVKNVKLALSLHSTDNGLRESIIPTSVKNKLSDLYKEISYFYQKTKNKVTYEYIYFEGLNDTDNDIKRLEKLLKMVPSNLNIIPFHPIDFELNKPLDVFNIKKDKNNLLSNKKLFDFIAKLKNNKVVTNLRSSSGVDINAACGQLAVKQLSS